MDEKKNNWLKLRTDFFQNLALKKFRKIAGGDTYIIIYQKIMLLTVNTEGHYQLQGIEKTIEEELALILDEDIENVKVCLSLTKSFNLLEIVNNSTIYLPQVPKLIGKNDDSSARVAAFRERKKLENISVKLPEKGNCNALQSLHVTESNAPRVKILEKDIDINTIMSSCDSTVHENLKYS